MRRYMSLASVALGFALAAGPAQAEFLTFFGEDLNDSSTDPLESFPNASEAEGKFLDNLVGTGTEDFEEFSAGREEPLSIEFPGAGTATLTGSGEIASEAEGTTNGFGRYGTSPTNYWETDAGDFVIDLEEETAAFGFFGIDIGDFGEQVQLFLNDSNSTLFEPNHTIGSGGSTDGSVQFFGLIGTTEDDTFTEIAFNAVDANNDPSNDVFAFDDMTIGSLEQVEPEPTPAPAPGTLWLFAGALLLLGPLYRRGTTG